MSLPRSCVWRICTTILDNSFGLDEVSQFRIEALMSYYG